MLKKELKFLEEIKKGKRESRKQNQNMSKFIPFAFSQNVTFSDGKIKIPGPKGKIITSAYLAVTFPMSSEIMSATTGVTDNQIEVTGWKNSAALNQVVWLNMVGFLIAE